jgi:hypothetical protein
MSLDMVPQKILIFFSIGKFPANGFGLWPEGALVLSAAADFNPATGL